MYAAALREAARARYGTALEGRPSFSQIELPFPQKAWGVPSIGGGGGWARSQRVLQARMVALERWLNGLLSYASAWDPLMRRDPSWGPIERQRIPLLERFLTPEPGDSPRPITRPAGRKDVHFADGDIVRCVDAREQLTVPLRCSPRVLRGRAPSPCALGGARWLRRRMLTTPWSGPRLRRWSLSRSRRTPTGAS
eukprot:COSAG01_NODE_715_length_14093_cov_64.209233_9_plen_195_part_00